MAAEEDKKFDAVLGGFLVNDPRVRAEHLHCPEPDVLAAYHERSLLPEEMNSWKEHIVGCARCQAIFSQLEATDSIPLELSEKEKVPRVEAAMPAGGKAVTVKVPEKSRVAIISRGVRWQWLAPAGALAAGLLMWVAWHEERPMQVKAPAEVKMARAEPPSTPAPEARQKVAASKSLDQSQSDLVAGLSKDQAAVGGAAGTASATKSLPSENLKQLEKFDSRVRTVPAKPSANKEPGAGEDALRDSTLAANRAQNQPADAKAGVAGVVSQALEVQAPAANAQMQNQQNQLNQVNAQSVGGPTPPSQAQGAAKKAKSESPARAYGVAAAPPPPTPAPSAAFSATGASHGLIAGALNLKLIVSPNKKVLWRAGHAGMIEFSSDGGASWSRQSSGVLLDLTAGAAPSAKVCWVVGRAGTILLTTDAGSHWAILHSPLEEDLGGVRATDALHATIWNSFNTKIFETSDGGITWKPTP
jgi:hypothetical protein